MATESPPPGHEQLHSLFFGRDHLEHTMSVLLQSHVAADHDFLVTILGVMCTQATHYMFSEHGFTPFSTQPLVIFPYSKMTRSQLVAVDACIGEAVADPVKIKVGSLMGGGSSVILTAMPRSTIDTVHLLTSLHGIVRRACDHCENDNKVSQMYNLIVQRLVCSTGLTREHIAKARDQIQGAQGAVC